MTTKPKPVTPRYADSNSELLLAVQEGSKKWSKTAMQSPETARAALQKMGILTPTGRLTKQYK